MLPTHPPSARVQRQRRDGLGGLGELERGISSLSCWRWWLLCEHFGTAVSSRCVYVSRACEEDSFSPGGGGARTRHILSQKIAHDIHPTVLPACIEIVCCLSVTGQARHAFVRLAARLVAPGARGFRAHVNLLDGGTTREASRDIYCGKVFCSAQQLQCRAGESARPQTAKQTGSEDVQAPRTPCHG